MPKHFETVARHVKALLAQVLNQVWVEFVDQLRIVGNRQIVNVAVIYATEMIMGMVMAVVTGGAVACGKLLGEVAIYQGFQRLVHGGQTDFGKPPAHGKVTILRPGGRLPRNRGSEQ